MFVGSYLSMGGKPKEGNQQPPTGAKDQDEEKFIQYVARAQMVKFYMHACHGERGLTMMFRDFIKQAEQEGEKAQKQGQGH